MTLKLKTFFNSHRHTLLAFTLFGALVIIDSWSLLTHLSEVLIGIDNDVFINPWADWWTAKALRDPQLTLWHTNYLFYPQGASLIYHSFSHLNTTISLLLQTFLDPISAYNLAILFNYVLAGLATFQLTRYLTHSTIAALLAGIVFTFNTHAIYQSAHPVLVSIWCIPWFTLYFMRAVYENKKVYAFTAAVFYFLAAFASILLFIITSLWIVALTAYLFFSLGRTSFPYRILLFFGCISFLLIFPLIYPLVSYSLNQGQSNFIIAAATTWPSDLAAFITPPWIKWTPRDIYLGLSVVFFLLVTRPRARWWWAIFVVTFLIVIGPQPKWAGQPLNVYLPWSDPIISLLRHAHRLNILLSFFLSILVGYGWVSLERRLKVHIQHPIAAPLVGLVLILLIYIDYTTYPFPVRAFQVSTFYTSFLSEIPDDIALATVPFERQKDKQYLFYQSFHHHPITGGVISRPIPGTYAFILGNPLLKVGASNSPVPSLPIDLEQEMATLAQAHIGYLVLHKDLMRGSQVDAWRVALPMVPVFEDEQLIAYAIESPH